MAIRFVNVTGKPVCINCGSPAQEQHHVVPRSAGGLATVHLCNVCHGLAHGMQRADIRELTRIGLAKARAQGVVLGRPEKITSEQREEILRRILNGDTIYRIAKDLEVDRRSIRRVRESAIPRDSATAPATAVAPVDA